jgi:hypothetical protein
MRASPSKLIFALITGAVTLATVPAFAAAERVAAKVPGSWDVRLFASSDTDRQIGAVPAEAFPQQVRAYGRENGAVMIDLPDREKPVWVLPVDVKIDLPADADIVCTDVAQGPNTEGQRGVSEICDD